MLNENNKITLFEYIIDKNVIYNLINDELTKNIICTIITIL